MAGTGLGGGGVCKCCGYIGFVNLFDYCWPCWDNLCHCNDESSGYSPHKECPGKNGNPYKCPNFQDKTMQFLDDWHLENPDKDFMNLPEMQPGGIIEKEFLRKVKIKGWKKWLEFLKVKLLNLWLI